MRILVTGGAGYIGTHATLILLQEGYEVIVLDNLVNSNVISLDRIEMISKKKVKFIEGDVTDQYALDSIFSNHSIDAVLHFAALKSVEESVQYPDKYFQNNVSGSISLLNAMEKANVNNFIYSSSATVYGTNNSIPYMETMKLGSASNPYGLSKVIVEKILVDKAKTNNKFKAVSLRYFNPIGAHSSGLIGEDPTGVPDNLLPYITQVAIGKRDILNVYGSDYPTRDGSCIRDYIHIMDLAEGHIAAINWLSKQKNFNGVEAFNLGTGYGTSVFEIISSFENVTGPTIKFKVSDRRKGDLAEFWANNEKAIKLLKWNPKRSLNEMLKDAWHWQINNPNGYI